MVHPPFDKSSAQPPAKVYIVDDDDGLRESLRAVLEAYRFVVEDHATGTSFLTSDIASFRGCLVLDLHMPPPDGLEVLACLRNQLKSQLPVVLVTGRGDKVTQSQALAAGANCYMEKPFDVELLIRTIDVLTNTDKSPPTTH